MVGRRAARRSRVPRRAAHAPRASLGCAAGVRHTRGGPAPGGTAIVRRPGGQASPGRDAARSRPVARSARHIRPRRARDVMTAPGGPPASWRRHGPPPPCPYPYEPPRRPGP